MKMEKIKFKVNHVKMIWLVVPAFLFAFGSCNSASDKKNNKSELSEEVQDVKNEVDEIVDTQKKELKNELDSVVADFDEQINSMEQKIKSSNKKLDAKTEEVLNGLKAERDTLYMKIDMIGNQTEQNWESFKEEVNHDANQFKESVKDFFKDNK